MLAYHSGACAGRPRRRRPPRTAVDDDLGQHVDGQPVPRTHSRPGRWRVLEYAAEIPHARPTCRRLLGHRRSTCRLAVTQPRAAASCSWTRSARWPGRAAVPRCGADVEDAAVARVVVGQRRGGELAVDTCGRARAAPRGRRRPGSPVADLPGRRYAGPVHRLDRDRPAGEARRSASAMPIARVDSTIRYRRASRSARSPHRSRAPRPRTRAHLPGVGSLHRVHRDPAALRRQATFQQRVVVDRTLRPGREHGGRDPRKPPQSRPRPRRARTPPRRRAASHCPAGTGRCPRSSRATVPRIRVG